jgi:CheY-like chemotaxis protein
MRNTISRSLLSTAPRPRVGLALEQEAGERGGPKQSPPGAACPPDAPRAYKAGTSGASGQTPPTDLHGKLRVLVIDDHEDVVESMATILELTGYEVGTAMDGPAGVERARAFLPHVVLLDIGLPEMDGYAVARALRETDAGRQCVLIALTGYGQDQDRERARRAGFDHHYVKPVDMPALTRLLNGISPALR